MQRALTIEFTRNRIDLLKCLKIYIKGHLFKGFIGM